MAVVLTVEELSEYLKLPVPTVYRLASKGELPGLRVGDSWQFDMDEIFELIKGIKKKIDQAEPPMLEEKG